MLNVRPVEDLQMAEAERDHYRMLFELAPAAYLVTDHFGVIREANQRVAGLLKVARQFLIGRPLAVFVATDERQELRDRLNRRLSGLDEGAWQLRLQPRLGHPVPVAVSTGVTRNQAGEATGLRWLLLELPSADPVPATPAPAAAPLGDCAQVVEPAGPTHPAVVEAMGLLESTLAHGWTLRELADRLHVSPSYLLRLFRSSTGMPPMAYLARRRVETAASLLLHTDQPVTQVGRAVGWPDQNYFARRFKAHFGMSATTYRSRFADSAGQRQALPNGEQVVQQRSMSPPSANANSQGGHWRRGRGG